MKKLFFLLVIVIAILDYGCKKADDYVMFGGLISSDARYAEKIKGKVMEVTVSYFWAKEENGKVIRGDVNPIPDKYTRNDFIGLASRTQFNESGAPIKYEGLGANRRLVLADAEGKIIKKVIYSRRDTLINYSKFTYTGNNPTEIKYYNIKTDTLVRSYVINYDQDGNRTKVQRFNYKTEPDYYVEFSYIYRNDGYTYHIKVYSASGELTEHDEYIYNKKGDRILEHNDNSGFK